MEFSVSVVGFINIFLSAWTYPEGFISQYTGLCAQIGAQKSFLVQYILSNIDSDK